MTNLDGVVQLLKKEHATNEPTPGSLGRAGCFRRKLQERVRNSGQDLCCWQGENRGCSKSTMGKDEGNKFKCRHNAEETHNVPCCTQADRCGTARSVGEGESG